MTLEGKNHPKLIAAILLIAFVVRLVWVLDIPTQPISDFKEFDRLAASVIKGQGFTNVGGQATAYRPPGYVFFLAGVYAVFGHRDIFARLCNDGLGLITCWLAYLLTAELFDHRTALVTAFLIAIFPSQIAWANILATKNLFIPIMLGIFIIFLKAVKIQPVRWKWIVLCGLLAGVGVLIRPASLLLPGILVLGMILKDRLNVFSIEWIKSLVKPASIGLVLYLLVFTVILPWSIRNTRLFGRFVLISTEGGITFLSGHNQHALDDEYAIDGPVFDALNAEKLDEVSYDKRAYQLAFQFIHQNPGFEARLLVHKFYNFFKDDVSGLTYNARSALTPLPDWLIISSKGIAQIFYILVLGLAFASIFLKRFPKDRWYYIQLVFIIAWTAFHLAYYGKDRFRLPLTPALAQFVAITILAVWNKRFAWFQRKIP